MAMVYGGAQGRQWFLLGEGPGYAARQLALLFTVGTALTTVKVLSVPGDQRPLFITLAVLQATAAAAGWWPVWLRLHPWTPLVLCLPAFVVLSASIV
ncbi:hypothetical protein [Planobispora rosea]|uniref:hypothetical protein n=1 Tax=Planobispora rosea TaxID=35762 RepID=UPI00083AC8AB|nr:hypothetical protein [Planobispora rosea]